MGDFIAGGSTFQDPNGLVADEPAGLFWRQVILSEQFVRFDEYEYPAYDYVITKKMGQRQTLVTGELSIVQSSEEEVEQMYQSVQSGLVNAIFSMTTPRGVTFTRAKVERFQGGQIMRWDSKNSFFMFIEFSFKALEASTA